MCMDTKKTALHVYSIRHVMDRTGLSARQIRYYEEVNLISPQRTSGNQRRFSERDIRRLLRIKELLAENLTTEAIRKVIQSEEAAKPNTEPFSVPPQEVPVSPQLDLGSQRRLTGLYPVSDLAALQRMLQDRRKDKE